MKRKSLLFLLLFALLAPWAANAQNSIPFNEGFESMTSVDDLTAAGWTLSTTESGTFLAIETSASNVYEGSKSLNLDAWDASSSSSVQYLGLPLVAGDLNTLQISFAYKVTSGTINVGYLTDATDFSTFTSLAQYSSSSSFTVKTTDLSEAPRDAARLVLKYTGWYRCYLDSFEVKALPSCQAATSITASDITATSATIAWEGEGNTWNLKYNGIEVNGISAMSYNLTGLTDGTNYTVSVQNVCSDGTTTDWISTTFRTPELCPEGKICIGEGTATSTYLPTYNFYNYSLTEQIYTAEEIGQAGAIESVDIFSVGTVTRTLEFYMVSTEKETFTDGTDWIAATASDLVYNGSVAFAANSWNTIEFDNPFIYDGRSNVALIVRDMTGSYVSGINFYVFDAPSQAIRIYRDDSAYDLANPGTGTVMNVKNRVRLVVGEAPTCLKPTGLTVSNVTNHTAQLSWTENGDATEWEISYELEGSEFTAQATTNPFTLTGLEPESEYIVKVRAICGEDDYSDWTGTQTFTTEVACPAPTNMNVSDITTNSAVVSWDGEGSFDLRYGTVAGSKQRSTLTYDFENGFGDWTTIDGDGDGYSWFTLTDLPNYTTSYGTDLSSWAYEGSNAVLSGSYVNGMSSITTDPDNLLVSPMVVLGGSISFYAKGLDGSYPEHFGVCVSTTSNTNVADFTVVQEWDTDTDTEYHLYTVDLSAYTGMGYIAIRDFNVHDMYIVIIDNVTIEEGVMGEVVWNDPITGVTSPYNLTGLDPETQYFVQVRANCGAEGYSEWVQRGFVTKGVCDVPTALTTTDVDASSATLGWAGLQDSYNVQYRPVFQRETYYFDDFTNDNWWSSNSDYYGLVYFTEGDNLAMIGYGTEDTQYLISGELPEFESGSTVEFYQRLYNYQSESTQTTFYVGYSTTTDDLDAFTYGGPVTVTSTSLSLYSEVIPSGAKYIAIKSTGGEDFGLMIDNFGIYGPVPEANEWTVVKNVTDNPYTINGLLAKTEYEWQVQGICADGETEWSATATFTTEPSCIVPTGLDYEINDNIAVLSWTSEATLFDIEVNEEVIEGVVNPYSLEVDPETIYEVRVRANCGSGDYSDWTDYIDFVTNCSGAKDLPYEFGFDLADLGEYIACWQPLSFNTENDAVLSYDPDDNNNVVFRFSSYTTASDYRQILISPELNTEAAVTVQFDYKAYSYSSGETFQVGYAIGDFTSLDDFIFGEEITATNSAWSTYTETLPAGTKYVAVLYKSDYMYYLYLDNFKFEESTGATQVLELSEGWNWVSFNVEGDPVEMLQALEAGLEDNALEIQSFNSSTEYDGEWWGDLDEIGITSDQMYMILVSTPCTVELEGMPVNVSGCEITINPGWNWIGYPGAEAMDIIDAFAEFEAEMEDVIQAAEIQTEYDGEWWGDLETLEPGQGYMYFSNSEEVKTLVFPTSAKVRRVVVSDLNERFVWKHVTGMAKPVAGASTRINRKQK